MTDRIEAIRINLLRVLTALLLALALALDPVFLGSFFGRLMWNLGVILIVLGILGRFWAILYIGGRKSARVVDQGPYSICRHPLYLFSTLATLGFGLMLQSVLFAVTITLAVFLLLLATASSEERKLIGLFGEAYRDYAARTPRILPKPSRLASADEVTFNVKTLYRNFADALVFLALIPLAEIINWWNAAGLLALIGAF